MFFVLLYSDVTYQNMSCTKIINPSEILRHKENKTASQRDEVIHLRTRMIGSFQSFDKLLELLWHV